MRRKRLSPELAGAHDRFLAIVGPLERAKRALTEAVPSTRFGGRALPDVLVEFEGALDEVRRGMPGWRHPALKDIWEVCSSGLDTALREAERLRLEAPDPAGFGDLIETIGSLLAPLEAFEEAAERFRELRT